MFYVRLMKSAACEATTRIVYLPTNLFRRRSALSRKCASPTLIHSSINKTWRSTQVDAAKVKRTNLAPEY